MTDKQRDLIEAMNEFCREKCSLNASVKEASEYIDRNIREYELLTMDDWQMAYM